MQRKRLNMYGWYSRLSELTKGSSWYITSEGSKVLVTHVGTSPVLPEAVTEKTRDLVYVGPVLEYAEEGKRASNPLTIERVRENYPHLIGCFSAKDPGFISQFSRSPKVRRTHFVTKKS